MPDNTDRDAAMAMFAALQRRAAEAGITLRQPPSEPDSCCGRGCNGCVWEGWYEAVDYWREEALLKLTDQAEACQLPAGPSREPPQSAPA